jgi:invasion protein IalB
MKKIALLASALIFTSFSLPALAADTDLIGQYGDWSAHSYKEEGQSVCFMASKPAADKGNYTRRGDIFAFITHRKADGTKNEFSYAAGYPYKADSEVKVSIDNKWKFTLFTDVENAWTSGPKEDQKIIDAIKRGSKMTVIGYSKRGTKTTDSFSLKGSSKAYEAINNACGVKG